MARLAVAAVIVIGLAAGVWWLWPREDPTGPSTTGPSADPITTTTPSPGETTTSTSEPGSHVVETVEEAEAILRDLWFGWFEGIYNQDEDRIREVVATEAQIDAAVAQFGQIAFASEPASHLMVLGDTEILRADRECLSVWAVLDVSALTGAVTEGVHVFRWVQDSWRLVSLWAYQEDLWENDCLSRF